MNEYIEIVIAISDRRSLKEIGKMVSIVAEGADGMADKLAAETDGPVFCWGIDDFELDSGLIRIKLDAESKYKDTEYPTIKTAVAKTEVE
jgi:hypothetical protein